MEGIARIQIKSLQALLDTQNLTIEFDQKAIAWLSESGFDPGVWRSPLSSG